MKTTDTYRPLESHDAGAVCRCVKDHNPNPMELHRHHILPLYAGGSDTADNTVWLCPTSHANVHELLRHYEKAGGDPGWEVKQHFGRHARALAYEGWVRMRGMDGRTGRSSE